MFAAIIFTILWFAYFCALGIGFGFSLMPLGFVFYLKFEIDCDERKPVTVENYINLPVSRIFVVFTIIILILKALNA